MSNKESGIANKAAEEGGLPPLPEPQRYEPFGREPTTFSDDQMRAYARQAIAADRASRQVANKAEVEPVAMLVEEESDRPYSKGQKYFEVVIRDRARCFDGMELFATPPATTGASTTGLESILDKLEDAIGGYSGGPFDKVQAIIDELRAAPDCGACPGDGSMCKSRCKVEEESPASTVLTDERIEAMYFDAVAQAENAEDTDHKSIISRFARAIEREIKSAGAASFAAQAGQVAVPEGFVLMPHRLTAENGAKGLLSGEFAESCSVVCPSCDGSGEVDDDIDCGECSGEGTVEQRVPVEWGTIKRIYDMAVEHLAAAPSAPAVAQQAPAEKPCTCPSGDGSLRWPCPAHPPGAQASTPDARQEGGDRG